MEAAAREHVERIRSTKFSIGGKENPLTEDLHQAVKNLSAELYEKDVHFLMELIQNAEDNEYPEGVKPSLEFVITSRDITATGAPATLLIFNNEKGFSSKNIESVCSVGRSTKKGNRKCGYIGEKGIGFKSVFLITSRPYIFSNGYQIRFNEAPCPYCNLGYIVPEWVDQNPSISDINQIYGSSSKLPTTTIILPLKADKVKPVKNQLSTVHPEVLLFLSKIKSLSIREHNEKPSLNTVNSIGITSETDFLSRKSIDAESYTLHLSAQESNDSSERQCSYYMWRQKFPVKSENRVERRKEVEEWVITLAFPFGERLNRGFSSPGVYAFLPTDMITNFPFIIQADFILQSSREKIQKNDKWNQGILNYVASAFISAFTLLVKRTDAPVSSLLNTFGFLPLTSSSHEELNDVRESIRLKLSEEEIVPSGSYLGQKYFHKPREVGRLMPAFWNILDKARAEGVNLQNLSSHGINILDSSFDRPENDAILGFLGLQSVGNDWYRKCIQGSNLVQGVSDSVYMELLLFLATNWQSRFLSTNMEQIPLIKYVDINGCGLCSISQFKNCTLCVSPLDQISWILDWNKEFRMTNYVFMPKRMRKAISSCSGKETVLSWLKEHIKVANVKVSKYAELLLQHLNGERRLVIAYAHFLFHSRSKKYLSEAEVNDLCKCMPLIDNYAKVCTERNGVLVPAVVSKWVALINSNLWREAGYVELNEDYVQPRSFAGENSKKGQLMEFLKSHVQASDIPHICPPNASLPVVSAPLKKDNAFLLLDWIRYLKNSGIHLPEKFLTSVREGSWLRIILDDRSDYRPPSQSFFHTASWGSFLQNGSIRVDIPLVDLNFYGSKINEYRQELQTVGVMFEYGEACAFIGKYLMSLAASSTLTKSNVLSMLNFIKNLREKYLAPDEFIQSVKGGRWLRTSCGVRSPEGAVLFDRYWTTAKLISDLPFIDIDYYGDQLFGFKKELELLGVIIGFTGNNSLVVAHLKPSSQLNHLTSAAMYLILDCMRQLSPRKLINAIGGAKCLKTNAGFDCPADCFLPDPEWGCLLNIMNCFHVIDEGFYGSRIFSYKEELKQIGVVVEFEEAVKGFSREFRQKASRSSISKENAISLLRCYRKLKGTTYKFPKDLKSSIKSSKWLRNTLTGFSSPAESILFGPEWESLRLIANLPFVDDSRNWYGKAIHEYKKELKSMGVVIELKDGVKLVATCLNIPFPPSSVTSASAISLLKCIGILLVDKSYSLSEEFLKKVSADWLKTRAGYRSPNQCLLFDAEWKLKQTDGPFIDEDFYGPGINLYRKELSAIGVRLDKKDSGELLFNNLGCHSGFDAIERIYSFLNNSGWRPTSGAAASNIFIPDGSKNGIWVDSNQCVLHDENNLFGTELHVLEKHYKPELLIFFSSTFNVRSNPSLDDYCKLWKVWEGTRQKLSSEECCAFWGYVLRHKSEKTLDYLAKSLTCLPVGSDACGITLSNKNDVFIADDLLLKDLFIRSSDREIFVWFPHSSKFSSPKDKLLEVYKRIGVSGISKCVERKELSLADGAELRQIDPENILISKSLVMLILGFLAHSSLGMEAKKRHETVNPLLNLTVLETTFPISMSYTLPLSVGEDINVDASQMIRWDKAKSKFFAQKLERSSGQRNLLQYATYFSQVISKGILWEKEDQVEELSDLIKLAFLVEMDEEAVGFLMKSRNLQVYEEDEEFLSKSFQSK